MSVLQHDGSQMADHCAVSQSSESPEAPIHSGVTLGRYQVQEYLGQGPHGPVYRAYDPSVSRSATVEVLEALRAPEVRQRLAQAAAWLVRVRHPNLVDVFELGERENVPYQVSARVEGVSLGDAMRGGISQEGALRILQGVARGVDHLHAEGIVHGDIRPATIVLGPDGRPMVRDGGLMPLLDAGFRGSAFGIRVGSLHYQAPEQLDRGEVSAATDRYAFATLAYALLTNATPLPGQTTSEILTAKERLQPVPASSREPRLGAAVDEVLDSGLARDPSARWHSCEQMVEALGRALADDAYRAQAAAYAPRYPAPAMTPVGPWAAVGPRPPARRWPWAVGVLAVLAGLALIGLFVFFTQQPQPSVSLSATSVDAGSAVVVTAHNLPAGQTGTIQLESDPVGL
ncbi:MAG TPA: serine/threonine-protein kinase, partial [Candidatus Dormibacteraeota bacterium]|nr:serine/threonine-protein kinase [Candidatus Dormibacteraeota bacterium]